MGFIYKELEITINDEVYNNCQGTNNQSNTMVCLASVMVTLYPT